MDDVVASLLGETSQDLPGVSRQVDYGGAGVRVGFDSESSLFDQLRGESWLDVSSKSAMSLAEMFEPSKVDLFRPLDLTDREGTERAVKDLRAGLAFDVPANLFH